MKKFAVIVAGGSGTRMGGGIPKQFRKLCGRQVLWWSLKAFHEEDPQTRIVVVLPEAYIPKWVDFCKSLPDDDRIAHKIVEGGDTRFDSVYAGLTAVETERQTDSLPGDDILVAVHDGARPLVTKEMISEGWRAAILSGAVIPSVAVTDSLRETMTDSSGNTESRSVDRSRFVAVQTPQVFRYDILKNAYDSAPDKNFTDDASVVERSGVKVRLYEGSPDNIKITNPKDLEIAGVLMKANN